ncbi:nitroimidazol reductase NimA-like FMN-containing flavoprotein (pyridoxamine 5'-phosphate oxidase superfamily) [Nocardioides sp. BE266]|uniref:pyridoxamine 5'-phosphate oxidase family protein n=1 Tax=Nocardioides sp. BE266 TaxID=2817725 RepID=UPI0028628C7D|nr:pyridoxamine 5'-phosphate oxidase family protein [Nocardioides sp. BE266]MDR7253239.1 nitroimidazol reductase NimA-like FMN-containing flavoprotein (pyridoxamine 5'-phosphate oxidase superfamily) [Nocardioides sp. BE266]
MDGPITPMSTEECWEFLAAQELGRLAYHLLQEVHIVPVNYAVDHDPATDRHSLLFRTAEGSKMIGVIMNGDVAFEADELEEDRAASVIVRGRARVLDEHEEHRAEDVRLRPWVSTLKYNVVEIDVTEISGRRFELSRPWRHMIPE